MSLTVHFRLCKCNGQTFTNIDPGCLFVALCFVEKLSVSVSALLLKKRLLPPCEFKTTNLEGVELPLLESKFPIGKKVVTKLA